MRFYSTEKIGTRQQLTPEGFLVCPDTPLARTGLQIYGPGETSIEPGPDGLVRVDRIPEEVFRPETIASFEGKPLVDEHPIQNDERIDVLPTNWRQLGMGTVLNVHRGEGIMDDLLVADIIIYDEQAIDLVRAGKRELSCGYNAEYVSTGQGRGQQVNIVGNHVALVDNGRCGPRCAIGDQKGPTMLNLGEVRRKGLAKVLRDAIKSGDRGTMDQALDELDGEDTKHNGDTVMEKETHMHVHVGDARAVRDEGSMPPGPSTSPPTNTGDAIDKRLRDVEETCDGLKKTMRRIADKLGVRDKEEEEEEKKARDKEEEEEKARDEEEEEKSRDNEKILGKFEFEKPEGTGDRGKRARDSAHLAEPFQDTIAIAEILVPGIRVPTFDARETAARTFDAMCGFRRRALDLAYAKPGTREIIDDILGGRTFDTKTSSCSDVATIFRAAGAMARQANNGTSLNTGDRNSQGVGGGLGVTGPIRNNADLNTRMREYYKNRH